MLVWFLVPLAWLAGVAMQLQEACLRPVPVYEWGVSLGLASLSGVLVWARARRADLRLRFAEQLLSLMMGLAAVAWIAWASTGWRASVRMAQHLPAAWAAMDVGVDVQVAGLPRSIPGGVLFDADVIRWFSAPGRRTVERSAEASADDDGHELLSPPAGDTLPQSLSLRMPVLNETEGAGLKAGQRWHLVVRLHEPDGLSNPAGFDPTLPYFERGVRAVGNVRDKGAVPVKLSDEPPYRWQGAIDRMRQAIRDRIFAQVPDKRAAGVLAGLSVGDQSSIEHADWDVFRDTGVAHLVSISRPAKHNDYKFAVCIDGIRSFYVVKRFRSALTS